MGKTKESNSCDQARRRLVKQGLYVVPTVLTLTTFLKRSSAQTRIPPAVVVNVPVKTEVRVNVRVTLAGGL